MAEYYNEKDKDNNEHKPKISVALEYTPGEEAPKIIASGKGALAERIIMTPDAKYILNLKLLFI